MVDVVLPLSKGIKGEQIEGKSLVDPVGYRTVKEQIESFFLAGARLNAERAAYYHTDMQPDADPDSLAIDPTVAKDFDFAEAHRLQLEVNERIRQQIADGELKRQPTPGPTIVDPGKQPPSPLPTDSTESTPGTPPAVPS